MRDGSLTSSRALEEMSCLLATRSIMHVCMSPSTYDETAHCAARLHAGNIVFTQLAVWMMMVILSNSEKLFLSKESR